MSRCRWIRTVGDGRQHAGGSAAVSPFRTRGGAHRQRVARHHRQRDESHAWLRVGAVRTRARRRRRLRAPPAAVRARAGRSGAMILTLSMAAAGVGLILLVVGWLVAPAAVAISYLVAYTATLAVVLGMLLLL